MVMDWQRICFGVTVGIGSQPGLLCGQVFGSYHRPKGRQGEDGDPLRYGEIHIGDSFFHDHLTAVEIKAASSIHSAIQI